MAEKGEKNIEESMLLTTDECIDEDIKLIYQIAEEASKLFINSIRLSEGFDKFTDKIIYSNEISDLECYIKGVIAYKLNKSSYEAAKTYEENLNTITKDISQSILDIVNDNSEYVSSRSDMPSLEKIKKYIKQGVMKWYLPYEEISELIEKRWLNKKCKSRRYDF